MTGIQACDIFNIHVSLDFDFFEMMVFLPFVLFFCSGNESDNSIYRNFIGDDEIGITANFSCKSLFFLNPNKVVTKATYHDKRGVLIREES